MFCSIAEYALAQQHLTFLALCYPHLMLSGFAALTSGNPLTGGIFAPCGAAGGRALGGRTRLFAHRGSTGIKGGGAWRLRLLRDATARRPVVWPMSDPPESLEGRCDGVPPPMGLKRVRRARRGSRVRAGSPSTKAPDRVVEVRHRTAPERLNAIQQAS